MRNNKLLGCCFFGLGGLRPLSFGGFVRQQIERGQITQKQVRAIALHPSSMENHEGF